MQPMAPVPVEFEPTKPKVPIGPSTVMGAGGSLALFAVAVIAFIEGDRSEETIGAILGGALVLYGVIQSRGRQATAQIQTLPPVAVLRAPQSGPGKE